MLAAILLLAIAALTLMTILSIINGDLSLFIMAAAIVIIGQTLVNIVRALH